VRHVIAFDVGTSGLKGVLVNEDGRVVARAKRPYRARQPRPGWSEQQPEDWWDALVAVARDLAAAGAPAEAIGLSGQMHGSVLLDKDGRVLAPAILWNDQRSAAECDEFDQLTAGRSAEWTLNPPRTAFTATKILWVRRHWPEVYRRIDKILLPKDYLRYRLSDRYQTDASDASGTNLFDVRARSWSRPTLAALEIPESRLPEIVGSFRLEGRLSAAAARQTGLPSGIPLVGGCADQAAAAIGSGVAEPGIVSITLGTSGVVCAQLGEPRIEASGAFHTFCHALPGRWQLMAGVLSAGGAFDWFSEAIGATKTAAGAEIEEVAPGSQGLIFLPYLTGERSPRNDPLARAGWIGLTQRHDRRHLGRAVLEGACYALRELIEILARLDEPIHELRVAGGGADSNVWLQILADVLGRPIVPALGADVSAYGAAILAMAGLSGKRPEALMASWIRTATPINPDPRAAELYEPMYDVFRALGPATQEAMNRLSAIERGADNPGQAGPSPSIEVSE
jgi:xylulokinase